MTIESPGNEEKKITKEDWANLIIQAKEILNRVVGTPPGHNNFSHITRNRASSLPFVEIDEEENNLEGYKKILRDIVMLDKYYSLIEEFPEFKEKEMSEPNGMFPDISATGEDSITAIDKMEERLRGKQI